MLVYINIYTHMYVYSVSSIDGRIDSNSNHKLFEYYHTCTWFFWKHGKKYVYKVCFKGILNLQNQTIKDGFDAWFYLSHLEIMHFVRVFSYVATYCFLFFFKERIPISLFHSESSSEVFQLMSICSVLLLSAWPCA